MQVLEKSLNFFFLNFERSGVESLVGHSWEFLEGALSSAEASLCCGPGGVLPSHTLPIRVCAAQLGRDFEAPDLERFRGVF